MPRRLQSRGRPGLARPLVLLGLEYAGRIRQADPESLDGWKLLGKLEMAREPIAIDGPPVRRYRLPFDPVHDLSAVRATYDLRRAHEAAPARLHVSVSAPESVRGTGDGRGRGAAARADATARPDQPGPGQVYVHGRGVAPETDRRAPREAGPHVVREPERSGQDGHRAPGARPRAFRRRVPRTGLSPRAGALGGDRPAGHALASPGRAGPRPRRLGEGRRADRRPQSPSARPELP